MQLSSMQDLMVLTLQDLLTAESQSLDAMPQIVEATGSAELTQGLLRHAKQTEGQIRRLEQVLSKLGEQPDGHHSRAAEGLLSEIREIIRMGGDPDVKDAALLAAQQKLEHNEIACYGTAVTFAKLLGNTEAADALGQSLQEEEQMDRELTKLAKSMINPEAAAS